MCESGHYWKNPEYADATLLLGGNQAQLEQRRVSLYELLNSNTNNGEAKRKPGQAAKTAKSSKRAKGCSSSDGGSSAGATAEPCTATASPVAASDQILEIHVHRITLCAGSDYFRTAFATLLGGNLNAARPIHPISLVHEEDTEAAQGALQYLYTRTVDSSFCTARQLMQLLVVSSCGITFAVLLRMTR